MKQNQADRLIVFTRTPEPGKTKTRLIAALGPRGAADLQRRMTGHTLGRVRRFLKSFPVRVEVRYAGEHGKRVRQWLGQDLLYSPQGQGDLGLRMERAFRAAFRAGAKRVVLIGSDCPGLTPGHLRKAFHALGKKDVVIGPALDGGYYLIGLRRELPDLFRTVPWGGERVLARTLEIASGRGLDVALLEPLRDVDRPEDLPVWEAETRHAVFPGGSFSLSIIIPALDEAGQLPGVLESTRDALDVAERIVVDGGSRDGTPERAAALGARVIFSSPGRAVQMNAGARVAEGTALLFLHADTRLPFGFDHHVRRILSGNGTAAGAFLHAIEGGAGRFRAIERLANFRSVHLQMPYGDQGIFLKSERFREAGGFPELPIMEDFELMRRLRRLGSVEIAPSAVISSSRRYPEIGFAQTTSINQLMILGYMLRVPPERLAAWYRRGKGRQGAG
jgi:rSAM/selenodomain-associated transferase 2/rSAM/selenodomain-associated transferase 1